MTLLHQAAQKAVEVLKRPEGDWSLSAALAVMNEARDQLESALQQQPEPVAHHPEIDRDSDGELLIDWAPGEGRMLSMTLRDDGRLSYAFRWDGETAHGQAQMPPSLQHQEVPREPVARMSDEMRDFIEGMSVSVDVSTGEHDAGNRYFGTVTEVMDDRTDKHGVTLLVQDAKPNFAASPSATRQQEVGSWAAKLWLWRNFMDGRPEYWAFDNPYPINLDNGDPQTLGEPCGYALFKPSRDGSNGRTEEQALQAIERASRETMPEAVSAEHLQLFKFYGVDTLAALADAQAHHIEKLQAKLPPTPSMAPQRVREG